MADEPKIVNVGRLAFRSEGKQVNAYLAKTDTMDDALLLGSINKNLLQERVDFWDKWKNLMTEMFKQSVANVTDVPIDDIKMPEQRAPEHERSGHS